MHATLSIARFTFIEALHTRVLWYAFALVGGAAIVAEFSAALAITDSQSYRTDIYGALSRLSAVTVIALFVITSIQRELQGRLLDLTWSRPVSRAKWYLGRLLGSVFIAALLALISAIPLWFTIDTTTSLAWAGVLCAELCLMAAASLAAAVSLRQPTVAVLTVAIFYLLGRTIDAIVLMSRGPTVDPNAWSSELIAQAVHALSLLVPALDRFAATAWLHRPSDIEVLPILIQSVVYIGLLTAVGLFDVYRHDE